MKNSFFLWVVAILALTLSVFGLVSGNAPLPGASTLATSKAVYKAPGFIGYLLPNQATSTLSGIGCVSGFATSSATAVTYFLSAAGATSTFNGTVYWKYGNSCPTN